MCFNLLGACVVTNAPLCITFRCLVSLACSTAEEDKPQPKAACVLRHQTHYTMHRDAALGSTLSREVMPTSTDLFKITYRLLCGA